MLLARAAIRRIQPGQARPVGRPSGRRWNGAYSNHDYYWRYLADAIYLICGARPESEVGGGGGGAKRLAHARGAKISDKKLAENGNAAELGHPFTFTG